MYMPSFYLGLELLHRREGLITEADCKRVGSSDYAQCKVVIQIILAKSVSESLKICGICEHYQLLNRHDMNLIKGVSVYDLCLIYFKFVQFSMKW